MNTLGIQQLKPLDLVAVRTRYAYQGKVAPFVQPDVAEGVNVPMPPLNIVDDLRWFTVKGINGDRIYGLDPDGATLFAIRWEDIVKVKRL